MKLSFLMTNLLMALSLAGCGSAPKEAEKAPVKAPASLEEAVQADYRSPEMRARDPHRHPVETLRFFGVEPQMTVIEIAPSAGWYTQILAPYLNQNGQYIAAEVPSAAGDYFKNLNDQRNAWLQANAELTGKTQTVEFNPGAQPIVADETADVVLTFRNVHNWLTTGNEQKAFTSFFKALKPGGVLGVVEHRANPKQKPDPKAKSGYMREEDVIRMAKKAGFQLAEKSEINANAKDTKDYPEGVWTLPPSLRLKEKDREKYLAIGESDRMTLKFVKPVKAKK